jgi:outer membrane protein
MKGFSVWIALFFVFSLILSGTAFAAGIELSFGAWNQDPKGDFSYKGISDLDELSIEDDLNYSDETKVFGRIRIESPPVFPNLYLMATPMDFSGRGTKAGTFRFGNYEFTGSVPFSSKLKLDHYDIGLFYGIPGLRTATAGVLNLDFGFDARIMDIEAKITGTDADTGLTVTETRSVVIVVPMFYLGMQVRPVRMISLEAEARGLSTGGNHYYDVIGRLKLKPVGPVFAAAGYRYEKLWFDESDVTADINLSGPFGEIGVEF